MIASLRSAESMACEAGLGTPSIEAAFATRSNFHDSRQPMRAKWSHGTVFHKPDKP